VQNQQSTAAADHDPTGGAGSCTVLAALSGLGMAERAERLNRPDRLNWKNDGRDRTAAGFGQQRREEDRFIGRSSRRVRLSAAAVALREFWAEQFAADGDLTREALDFRRFFRDQDLWMSRRLFFRGRSQQEEKNDPAGIRERNPNMIKSFQTMLGCRGSSSRRGDLIAELVERLP